MMQKVGEIQEIPICGSAFSELAQETVTLARLADYPIVSLTEGTSSHDFYLRPLSAARPAVQS